MAGKKLDISVARKKLLREKRIADGVCASCGEEKTPEFKTCQPCRRKQSVAQKTWKSAVPSRTRERNTRCQHRLKELVIGTYGGKCACCEDTHLVFLCIDHILENGAAHRKELSTGVNGTNPQGTAGNALYRWLRNNNYPPGFQVLCFNCNFAKHVLGQCPHQLALAA